MPPPEQFQSLPLDPNVGRKTSVSIIIAACGEGEEVIETVKSARGLAGEVGSLEIVVVDDTRNGTVCRRLPGGVKLIEHREQQGAGRSKNEGAGLATGEVLIFPDAHMRFPPHTFRDLASACVQYRGIACCGVQHRDKARGCQGWGAWFRFHRRGRLGVQYNRFEPGPGQAIAVDMPFGGTYAFHRSAFRAIGGWTDSAARWGYCEQPLGVAAWMLDMKVLAVHPIVKHLFRKVNPSGATADDVWMNVAFSHYIFFSPETNRHYWTPILRTHLGARLNEVLGMPELARRRANFKRLPAKKDEDFFREKLGVTPIGDGKGNVRGVRVCSVILPAYNEGKEVLLTVRSVGQATRSDAEIIIVDDASTDGSCDRIDAATGKKRFPDIVRILRNKQRFGVCRSRLIGIGRASEDVLIFMDAHSRCSPLAVDKLMAAAWESKGFVTGAITGLGEDKPHYGGRFCVKPGWGLRLAYWKRKPEKVLNRITGPIGSCYAVRRDVLKRLRSWPPLPGKWAYSEQAIGLKAYNLGIPIFNLADILIQHKMKKGTIDVPLLDVLLNAHFIHRAYFDEDTYTDIWRPILLERGYDPAIDELLKSKLLRDEIEWFQANRRRTDEEFFRHVLAAEPEDLLDLDLRKGRAKPRTQASYIAYESRRSPGREWLADRPRMERHLKDLLEMLRPPYTRYVHLDLGSRDGWILDRMVGLGFKKGRVHGMELVPWTAKHARRMGRDVDTGDIHDLGRWKDGIFNLLTIIHALEHCHTPTKVLSEAQRVLRPGGLLMVVVPLEPKKLSVKGDHCYAMRNEEAVKKLVAKCGFEILKTKRFHDELTLFGRRK